MKATPQFLTTLQDRLSPEGRVLSSGDEFTNLLIRWSDIDRKTPAAVVLVSTEEDVVLTVRLAVEHGIPFVAKSGGHSTWSTIGSEGIIIDLSRLTQVTVDAEKKQVTLQSGVLVKQANKASAEHDLYLPLGSANTAGVIPMALGGGLSALSCVCGFASDNIVSAKLVTATGQLVSVSATSHPDLLYALRGAGQFFGIVTELTLQAYPPSILRTPDATAWTGVIVYSVTQIKDVLEALKPITQDTSVLQAGLCVITAPPPTFDTCMLVMPFFFGLADEAEAFYASLKALGPLVFDCKSVPFTKINDGGEAFGIKGGFKRFAGVGMKGIDTDTWEKVVEIFSDLKGKHSDACTTGYGFDWCPTELEGLPETAFSQKDIKMWAECLTWYSDPATKEDADRAEKAVLDLVRQEGNPESNATYGNWTRSAAVEERYRGAERLAKLRTLKRHWDPQGVFTREFL